MPPAVLVTDWSLCSACPISLRAGAMMMSPRSEAVAPFAVMVAFARYEATGFAARASWPAAVGTTYSYTFKRKLSNATGVEGRIAIFWNSSVESAEMSTVSPSFTCSLSRTSLPSARMPKSFVLPSSKAFFAAAAAASFDGYAKASAMRTALSLRLGVPRSTASSVTSETLPPLVGLSGPEPLFRFKKTEVSSSPVSVTSFEPS